MSTRPLGLPLAFPRFERVERERVVAGICAGIADRGGGDPTAVRLAFAFLAFAGGAGILAYLGLWLLLPAPGEPPRSRRRRIVSVILLMSSLQFALRGLGLADSLVWPLLLAGLTYLVWSRGTDVGLSPKACRIIAVFLTIGTISAFVTANTRGSATSLLAPGAVAIALLLVLLPWAWRLVRERDEERDARVRVEERADFAARVHDSVLQTLALIQRDPSDPRRVTRLARRQERELRAWLYPDRAPTGTGTLADAIESAAAEIEELHGVRVEIVRTGDAPLDDRTRALVLAAREAMANAAKHSGVDDVSVFLDAENGRVALYVRDRGAGFDPGDIAADRRGIAESIRGRMERVGGTANVSSAVGEGTEVELELQGRRLDGARQGAEAPAPPAPEREP